MSLRWRRVHSLSLWEPVRNSRGKMAKRVPQGRHNPFSPFFLPSKSQEGTVRSPQTRRAHSSLGQYTAAREFSLFAVIVLSMLTGQVHKYSCFVRGDFTPPAFEAYSEGEDVPKQASMGSPPAHHRRLHFLFLDPHESINFVSVNH